MRFKSLVLPKTLLSALALLMAGLTPLACDLSQTFPEVHRTIHPPGKKSSPTTQIPPVAGNPPISQASHGYLFCFWNVENLFDDQDDNRQGQGDKEYDSWYASRHDLLKLKLSKHAEVLLNMNQGRGPDILCLVEVESVRAAQLLQYELNGRLPPELHYQTLIMKEVKVGRHIAPAILSRLPADPQKCRVYSGRHRIIEGHLFAGQHPLIVVASHWTSRLTDQDGKSRGEYAQRIYQACDAIYRKNPQADIIVCGDFNDGPNEPSVTHSLQAGADTSAIQNSPQLRFINLLAGKDPNVFGTHFYRGWHIFDQIVVSPGMLDGRGWSCDVSSVQPVRLAEPSDPQQRPWRFGSAKDTGLRGYSDHLPVMVRLQVQQ